MLWCWPRLFWPLAAPKSEDSEVARLARLLEISPGMTVAEIGAGEGELTTEMARFLGAGSKVFATEISESKVEDIVEAVQDAGLDNVTALLGSVTDTMLPEACCDAVFMRTVYHHFTQPGAMNANLMAALRDPVVDWP